MTIVAGVELRKGGSLIRRPGDLPPDSLTGDALREFMDVEQQYCDNRDQVAAHLGIEPGDDRWSKVERLAREQTRHDVRDAMWFRYWTRVDRNSKDRRPADKLPEDRRGGRSARRARAANPTSRDWFSESA